jgi:hypothetical protein
MRQDSICPNRIKARRWRLEIVGRGLDELQIRDAGIVPTPGLLQHCLADVESDDKAGFAYESGHLPGVFTRSTSYVRRAGCGAKLHQREGFALVGTKELKRVHCVQTADQFGRICLVYIRKIAQETSRLGVCC